MIDEWLLYFALFWLLYLGWIEIFVVVGLVGALCLKESYRFYWRVLYKKCGEELKS